MADVNRNYDLNYADVTLDKTTVKYRIQKDRSGYRFFEIVVSKGPVPEMLKGKYSSIENAVRKLEEYERHARETPKVKNQKWQKQKEAARAELRTEDS